jgi:phenylacetate-coenzyme A ligase PaaK-like adenylate-forming protein
MNGCMALEDLLHPWLGKYLGAPGWLKASAGRAYACLPQRVRLGGAYQRFCEDLAAPAQGHGAADRLGAALEWALATVPAYEGYRHLLAAARDPHEALAQLPVTDKLDIKRHPERYLSTGMPASARLEMYTGGSTRNPMRFFLQKHVTRAKEFAYVQDFRARIGMGSTDTVLALRGRTVPTAAQPGGRIWMYEPIKRQLILSSDHLERRYMPAYAEALAAHRPTYIEAFPSALYPLARWLAANPVPEFTRGVKGVMLYSENVYGYQLDKIREVFPGPVVSHYGHSERVLMAASMPDDDRYFFWPRYGHFELLDAENRPVTQPGKLGFIVGTSFDNRVMPFMRYRTGDLGVLSERGDARLAGFPACERIVGRLQEFIVCRDHRLVSITTLGVAHFPELAMVDAIQYEQERPGHVVLKVAADAPLEPAALTRIARAVEQKTQGGCDVEVVQVPRIARTPRGKARMLVQHLDIRRYFGSAAEKLQESLA